MKGITLGLVVGTAIWLWLFAVDAIAGEPMRTFSLLGGVGRFTVLHYTLCCVYGVVGVTVVRGAARESSLLIGAVVAFILVELAFVFVTAVLAQVGLGRLAWVRIMGGNLMGAILSWTALARIQPLGERLRHAGDDDV